MKKLFLLLALSAGCTLSHAVVKPVNVADSTVTTVSGIGGYTEVAYAFAKGDKITVVANASKQLERAMIVMPPTTVLVRVKDTKRVNQTFEMPENGTVYIRFVSDRGGENNVHYSIVRLPASEAVQDYSTVVKAKGTAIGYHD